MQRSPSASPATAETTTGADGGAGALLIGQGSWRSAM